MNLSYKKRLGNLPIITKRSPRLKSNSAQPSSPLSAKYEDKQPPESAGFYVNNSVFKLIPRSNRSRSISKSPNKNPHVYKLNKRISQASSFSAEKSNNPGIYPNIASPKSAQLIVRKYSEIADAMISDVSNKQRSISQVIKLNKDIENSSMFSQAIDALFKMVCVNQLGEAKAYDIVKYIISLNLSTNSKLLVSLFKIFENVPFVNMTINKYQILKVCEDPEAEKRLQILILETKRQTLINSIHGNYNRKEYSGMTEFDQILMTIQKL